MENRELFNETHMKRLMNLVLENFDFSRISNDDLVEVFHQSFRSWVRQNLGEEIAEYPMSYLINKYSDDYLRGMGIYEEYVSGFGDFFRPHNVGKLLIKKGLHKFRTLRPEKKFTEKLARPLASFIKDLKLPDYIKVVFEEETPNEIDLKIVVQNYDEALKGKEKISLTMIQTKIKNFFKNFLGVEFGNPIYGEVSLDTFNDAPILDLDEWTKKVLNGKIKKAIKLVDEEKIIHRVSFKPSGLGGKLILFFKKDKYTPYVKERAIRESIQKMITEMGYNPNILEVENG